MDGVIKTLLVIGCIFVCAALLFSSGSSDTPIPDPTPASDMAVVVQGFEPLVESAAGAVEANTQAALADLATAHPQPRPGMLEVVIWPLAFICIGCGGMAALCVAFVTWRLCVNQERMVK